MGKRQANRRWIQRPGTGLTLAETLVSMTLLTLLLVSVLNLLPSSMAVVRQTRTDQLARIAAQNKLEILAARPFADLPVGYDEGVEVSLSDGSPVRLRTTVGAVEGYPPKRLKRLRCVASWTAGGRQHRIDQEFYVHSIRR